jgi:hypothetical protein
VQALYKKYPTVKSSFCPACKLWVNPYFKSIADTQKHMPLITYEYYTKANAALVNKLNIPRSMPKKGAKIPPGSVPYNSIFGTWHSMPGQVNEDAVYKQANVILKKTNDEANIGHCQAWILNAFAIDAVIFTDTYTFNAAVEDKWQNIGSEINTEELTRKELQTGDVQVWCGTFGNQGSFTAGKVTDIYPAYYWKVILFNGTTTCYWMPNVKTDTQAFTPHTVVTYAQLIKNLGFDPVKVFPGK